MIIQDSTRPEQMELKTFKLTLSTFSNISTFTTGNDTDTLQSEGPFQAAEVVIIVLVTGSLSLVTITGNILVLLSIIINRNLHTINNYFLCSLACADLIIGVCSMNLFTVYIVVGYWPLGPAVCDLWLVLDYVVCCASGWNLLIISFDRYFCVTKPLSYPAKRTTRMACIMIAAAWVISFILWAPPILLWQGIVGERTVPEGECYVQFLSNPTIIFIATIATFYLPVAIMMLLYWQISRASKSRVKNGKQNPKQDIPSNREAGKHSTMPCDDENVKTHHTERIQNGGTGGIRAEKSSGYEGNPKVQGLNTAMEKQWPTKKTLSSREKKVTRTVMAILAVFVVTWSPYCVMVLITAICSTCVPSIMWTLSFWSAYLNSTINPACYALCNDSIKKSFKQLLLCQHKNIHSGR